MTRKDKVGRTETHYRAQRHTEMLDGCCDEAEMQKIQKLPLIDAECGVIMEEPRK